MVVTLRFGRWKATSGGSQPQQVAEDIQNKVPILNDVDDPRGNGEKSHYHH